MEQRKQATVDTCVKQITFGLKYLSAGIKMRIEASAHFIMAGVFSLKHGAALQCYVPFNCFKEG